MSHELYETLRVGQLQQGEFEYVLSAHFKGGAIQKEHDFVDYPNHQDGFGVRVKYDGARIVDLVPGSMLAPSDIQELSDAIENVLVADSGFLVGHRVLFADIPVTAQFRYKDIFQIDPVPLTARHITRLNGIRPMGVVEQEAVRSYLGTLMRTRN